MFKLKTVVAAASLMALPAMSQAAGPTLTDIFANSGITEAGYVDTGFTYSNTATTGGAFTGTRDAFVVHQAALTLAKQPSEGFGGLVNVVIGEDAKVFNPNAGSDFALTQAFAQYATGNLTIMAGRFVTLDGMELIASTGNSNASRSLLFAFIPFLHDGVRATYKINDVISVTGGLVNSATSTSGVDGNKQKTVEASVALAPITGLTVFLTDYYGAEGTNGTGGASTTNNIFDLVASYQLTKDIGLGLNADFGNIKTNFPAIAAGAKTAGSGVAGYVNYQICDKWRESLRVEYLSGTATPPGGPKVNTGDAKEVTLTTGYAAASNFDLLGEVRFDKNNTGGFLDDNGKAKSTQTNVGIKAIYKF